METRGFEPLTSALQKQRSSQLSYVPEFWTWRESNPRPLPCEDSALPTELQALKREDFKDDFGLWQSDREAVRQPLSPEEVDRIFALIKSGDPI